jgi:hypothetical protein
LIVSPFVLHLFARRGLSWGIWGVGCSAALWLEEVQGDPHLSARTKEENPDRVLRLLLPTFVKGMAFD